MSCPRRWWFLLIVALAPRGRSAPDGASVSPITSRWKYQAHDAEAEPVRRGQVHPSVVAPARPAVRAAAGTQQLGAQAALVRQRGDQPARRRSTPSA